MSKNATAILSEDVEFKGVLSFSNQMELRGRFEGEIIADGCLIIGEAALVKATITSSNAVIIQGKVQGNITAKDKIEVAAKAELYGDVVAPKFILADGAVFVGSSKTQEKAAPPSSFNNIFSRLDKPKSSGSFGSSPSSPDSQG